MLGVDLTPALVILGTATVLAVAVRVALVIGAARAKKRGAAILATVPKTKAAEPDAET